MAEYLKLPEVARRLDVSEKTARRYVKSGVLPSVFIGNAYRVNEEDLQEYLRNAKVEPGKVPRRSPYEPTLLNGLEEERHAEWESAVDNARQLRERGRARMEELLLAWRESKERGDAPDARDVLRSKMGQLLQEAFDAKTALQRNVSDNAGKLDLLAIPIPEWEEVIEADRFYWVLREMVEEAGLYIRTKSTQKGEAAQAGQPQAHNVKELEAA